MSALSGIRALVTSGPTHEPIDPVRFLGNRSSGRQGHAVAQALAKLGAEVTLVAGPVSIPDPAGMKVMRVTTAQEMLAACEMSLPVEVAICAAAVADWRPARVASQKIKKNGDAPSIELVQNPDILKTLSCHAQRPRLVIGFAAETEQVLEHARAKRLAKGCDWMLANDVAEGKGFEAEENEVTFITADHEEQWPRAGKDAIARQLVERIAEVLKKR